MRTRPIQNRTGEAIQEVGERESSWAKILLKLVIQSLGPAPA